MVEADGLYFMRARFYDPEAGRFLSKDPLNNSLNGTQSSNYYGYVGNRPLFLTDPTGLYWQIDLEASLQSGLRAGLGFLSTPTVAVESATYTTIAVGYKIQSSLASLGGDTQTAKAAYKREVLFGEMARDTLHEWSGDIVQVFSWDTGHRGGAKQWIDLHPELESEYERGSLAGQSAVITYDVLSIVKSISSSYIAYKQGSHSILTATKQDLALSVFKDYQPIQPEVLWYANDNILRHFIVAGAEITSTMIPYIFESNVQQISAGVK